MRGERASVGWDESCDVGGSEGARGGALMKVVCLQVLVCFNSCEKGRR